jgi:hypothetical protein
MKREKTQAQPIGCARGDDAMPDMGKPGAGERDHAPPHPREAGIETENANRCAHRLFVPLPFMLRQAPFDKLRVRVLGFILILSLPKDEERWAV